MPNLKSKTLFERSATADLFRHTLSRIPSIFGRLCYLASLRDANSGVYRHYGLETLFGPGDCRKALARAHRDAFQDWLNLPQEEKTKDLRQHLHSSDHPSAVVLSHWRETQIYGSYLPAATRAAERELFVRGLGVLIEILSGAAVYEGSSSWPLNVALSYPERRSAPLVKRKIPSPSLHRCEEAKEFML